MLMTTLLKSSNGITQVSVDTARNISIRLNLPLDEVLYMPAEVRNRWSQTGMILSRIQITRK